jgi:hypothetical protein
MFIVVLLGARRFSTRLPAVRTSGAGCQLAAALAAPRLVAELKQATPQSEPAHEDAYSRGEDREHRELRRQAGHLAGVSTVSSTGFTSRVRKPSRRIRHIVPTG